VRYHRFFDTFWRFSASLADRSPAPPPSASTIKPDGMREFPTTSSSFLAPSLKAYCQLQCVCVSRSIKLVRRSNELLPQLCRILAVRSEPKALATCPQQSRVPALLDRSSTQSSFTVSTFLWTVGGGVGIALGCLLTFEETSSSCCHFLSASNVRQE